MSTPLPGSSSDDFEQSKNTIFMKHPPDCQLSSTRFHQNTEWYDSMEVPGVSFNSNRHLTMVGKLVSTPLPGLFSDYHEYNFII